MSNARRSHVGCRIRRFHRDVAAAGAQPRREDHCFYWCSDCGRFTIGKIPRIHLP
jgi:hypothetical protein